ncbi:MAG: DUF503 domain-containing protein [Chloroflexi bacterium]|nr:DUF503 domain-containing protein [Chloroflexota bacterium]MDA1227920.1 DUF503 domain-containing protein [Chloroflexota bacterium]
MNVGVCKVRLRIPESQSLKGKRGVIKSLSQRIRNKFNVSVSEVDDNESWQMATLGITCAGNNARHIDEVMNNVLSYIESSRDDLEIVETDQENISGF